MPFRRNGLRYQPCIPGPVHQPRTSELALAQTAELLAELGELSRTHRPRRAARPDHRSPRGTTGPDAAAHAAITGSYVAVLRTLKAQIAHLAGKIAEQLDVHPDAAIFTSLPRSGRVRAARLLAEIGDARGRFPTQDSLARLAGVAPSTRQSGKVKAVTFRWGANTQLRDALCDSRRHNIWAADLYAKAIARGHDHPHAVRILGRAWAHIIWRCWQNNTPYHPADHGALQRILNQDQKAAA